MYEAKIKSSFFLFVKIRREREREGKQKNSLVHNRFTWGENIKEKSFLFGRVIKKKKRAIRF